MRSRSAAPPTDARRWFISTAIVAESPPDATFESVNVNGTRNLVRESERADVRRFVYVSSLGADRGESPYHKSKLRGEEVARTFDGSWIIIRPGNVYGSGDEQLSTILRMVRSLPAIPVIAGGRPAVSADLGERRGRGVGDGRGAR